MYSDRPLPEAISHRGLCHAAPENSVPAFSAAVAAGAEGIELDVHVTSDEVLLVHHDAGYRIGDDMVPFRSLDAAEVAGLKLSGGVPIPTLDEALESIGAATNVYVEVKVAGVEAALTRCLRRHAANVSRYSVHAFDHRIVRRMLELIPSVRTGILQVSYLIDSSAAMRKAGAADLWQHADFVDERLVADVHSCGGRIVAWTANDETAWERLAKLGVDGICTDRIDSYIAWRASVQGDS